MGSGNQNAINRNSLMFIMITIFVNNSTKYNPDNQQICLQIKLLRKKPTQNIDKHNKV